MSALRSRRRRRTLFMLTSNLVAVAAIAVLLVVGVRAVKALTGGKDASNPLPVQTLPKTPTGFLATINGDKQLTSVTVFVLAPGDRTGGSIISIPVNADSTFGFGDERQTLQQAYAAGGDGALLQAVEATLSVTIDFPKVADAAAASALLATVAPITVDLPRTVVGKAKGKTEVIFQRGSRPLTSAEAVQVLTAEDPSVNEAARRPNLEALWAGVGTAIGTGKTTPPPPATATTFEQLVARLFAGPAGTRGLPAAALPTTVPNQAGIDAELLDQPEEILVFASLAPSAMSRPAVGLNFRVVAPPGFDLRVKQVVLLLLYSKSNIISIDLQGGTANHEPTPKVTEMTVYDSTAASQVTTPTELLGNIKLIDPTTRIEGIDATIVLGTDYLNDTKHIVPPSTTSTTDPAAVAAGADSTSSTGG